VNAKTLIATPVPITYCTPRIDMDSLIEIDEIAELDDHFNSLEFSAHGISSQVEIVGFDVAEPNNTNLEVSQNETGLLSMSVDSDTDKVESSLEAVTEKRNVAVNEHEEEHERGLLFDASSQPDPLISQESTDGQDLREFVASGLLKTTYSVTDERNLLIDAPETPWIELPIDEASFSALCQAIEECFSQGFELDVTISQQLSMLTYIQGHPSNTTFPSDTMFFVSYRQMELVTTLAKSFIGFVEDSNAVSFYKRVIMGSCLLLNENEYRSPMVSLECLLLCSATYLGHEQVILQIVIAGYLKMELASESPSAVASRRLLGMMKRLRVIRNAMLCPVDEDVDQKLLSLTQTIKWYFEQFAYQFRHELLPHALGLAKHYWEREEFEAAQTFPRLKLTPGSILSLSRHMAKAEQSYMQHPRRRYSRLKSSRVEPGSMPNLQTLPPNSSLLLREKEIDFLVTSLYQSLIGRAEQFDDAHRTPLVKSKGSVKVTNLDTGTDTGFATNSIRRRQSELGLVRTRRAPLPKKKEGLELTDLDTETDTGFTTSSTRSYKYGVTMSDSDVLGLIFRDT
jgi:hypothetical protein